MPLLSGAKGVVETLKACKVELVFGLTGHTVMEVADELAKDATIRSIYPRSELNGTYMAYGYNRIKGAANSVCIWHVAGSLYAAPAVMTAKIDSTPMVVICGNVSSDCKGKQAFQETPIFEVYEPITKWAYRVERTEQLPWALQLALHIASSNRPGPVVLDVPFDKFVEKAEMRIPEGPIEWAPPAGDPKTIKKACELLLKAKKPVLIAGGGVAIAEAGYEAQRLAELLCMPIVTGRSSSKGVVSEEHPLCLGILGSFGWRVANEFLSEADCWCAVGTTFSQIAMQDWSVKPPETLIHIDIDPSEFGKIYQPTVAILGDAKRVLQQMIEYLEQKVEKKDFKEHPRYPEIKERKEKWLKELDSRCAPDTKPINPYRLIKEINLALPPDGIVVGDAGNNGEFAVHVYKALKPRTFLLSQKYSAVGTSFPAALGAKLASPNVPVVAVEGDGGFHYNCAELATAVMEKIPVIVVVFNDGYYNSNRQIANRLFEGRQVWTKLNNPDWAAVAKSFGAEGERVDDTNSFREALKRALKSDVPYVIDAIIDRDVPAPVTGKLWKIRW
jgi:acetolactate synthase-1/2/3 large subunit